MSYEEQIKEILDESKESILAQTKEALKQKIVSSLDWSLGNEISKIVKEVIENELKDEIQKTVLDAKQDILNSIQPLFVSVGAEVAKAMKDKVVKTLNDSWKADKVIKSLFE